MIQLKRLGHVLLKVADVERSKAFYADLLNSHGFPVRMQSGPTWPRNLKAWVDGSDHALGEGPGIDIHIDIEVAGKAVARLDLLGADDDAARSSIIEI